MRGRKVIVGADGRHTRQRRAGRARNPVPVQALLTGNRAWPCRRWHLLAPLGWIMKSLLQIVEVRFHLQVRVVIAKTSFNLIEIIETIVEIKVGDDGMGLLGILIETVGRRRIGNHGLVHLLHQAGNVLFAEEQLFHMRLLKQTIQL